MYLIYLPNISLTHCNDTYLWLSPNLCLNSDGDTGAFFRVKNYRREFFARKPTARTWRYCPSELPS